jgi:hypothetical protein
MVVTVILSRSYEAGLQPQEIIRFVSRSSLGWSKSWESGCTLARLLVQKVDVRIVAVRVVQVVHVAQDAVVEIEWYNVLVVGPGDGE